MDEASLRRAFAGLVTGQLVIFIVSLPGFGIETRKPSDYAAWAGPLFLLLTILVIGLGVLVIAFMRTRSPLATRLGLGQALAAVATNLLDISHVGGPAPPPGPLALGLVSIGVAIVTIVTFWRLRKAKPAPSGQSPA